MVSREAPGRVGRQGYGRSPELSGRPPYKGASRNDFTMKSRNVGGPIGGVVAQYGPSGPRQARERALYS